MNVYTRAATLDDAAAIDEMLNSYALVHQGRSLGSGAALDRLARPEGVAALIEDQSGQVLGFGHAWPAGLVVRCYARVRPDAIGRGVGTALLAHLEQQARVFGLPVFTVMQPGTDTAGPALLRAVGYTELCHRLQMRAPLVSYRRPLAPPPASVQILGFDRDRDGAELFAAFRAAFPDDPVQEAEWWQERHDAASTPPSGPALWFIARQAGAGDTPGPVVGFSLGSRREWQGAPDGYVSDVGVVPAYRGAGLGFALLTATMAAFADAGLPTATLDVDADNLTGALRLYRKAGLAATPLSTEWTKQLSG